MKHIFVINPIAGKHDSTSEIAEKVTYYASTHQDFDYDVYLTTAVGDATKWTRRWCRLHKGEKVRFYACGGDGTLNEVVSGIIGSENVEVTVYASGSGNDYIKYYGTQEDFCDMPRLIEGDAHQVDVMKVNNRYSINICNFGFDAIVCKSAAKLRHHHILGGSRAYPACIAYGLLVASRNYVKMSVDGEPFFDGKMLLCTLGNGRWVGGKYQCSPKSQNDDGLIEVTLMHTMSIFTLLGVINPYSKGTFHNLSNIKKLMQYRRGTQVEISAPKPFWVCIDGEMILNDHYTIQNLPQAITFVSPRKP